MPVTYTNRKGKTYYLCQGTTKAGKPWYYFAPEPKDQAIDAIPEGYEIRENVNGLVSLALIRPQKILPKEVTAVEAAIAHHKKSHNLRMEVKGDRIVIATRIGPDAQELLAGLGRFPQEYANRVSKVQETLDRHAQFKPELRFILEDENKRIFSAERWHYGGREGWAPLLSRGSIKTLARKLIPKLGTEAFFDLY